MGPFRLASTPGQRRDHAAYRPIHAPVGGVFIPALCRLQGEPARYRRIVFRPMRASQSEFCFRWFAFRLRASFNACGSRLQLGKSRPYFYRVDVCGRSFPIRQRFDLAAHQSGPREGFPPIQFNQLIGDSRLLSHRCAIRTGGRGIGVFGFLLLGPDAGPISYCGAAKAGDNARSVGTLFRAFAFWVIVVGATWLIRLRFSNFDPLEQSLICAPVGLLSGFAFLSVYAPSERRYEPRYCLAELLESCGFHPSAR